MYLNLLVQCTPSSQFEGLWRNPRDRTAKGYRSLSYWTEIGTMLEAACIDALFFADVPGIYDVYHGSIAPSLRHAVQIPMIDPVPVVAAIAAHTRHLGLVFTYSTTVHPPFECARLFSSLDHLTAGRIGWNIVTSYMPSLERNGLGQWLTHDRRYDRADEYVEVCRQLWTESWEDRAVLRDPARDCFVDPEQVHLIAHRGEWFEVEGPHVCEPSPQRVPLLYQAGASTRGTQFAANHAEVVFGTYPTAGLAARHIERIRDIAAAAGRDPASIKVLQAAFVMVGASRADVKAQVAEFNRFTSIDGELAKISGWMGLDFGAYPDDTRIADIPIEASRTLRGFLEQYDREHDWTLGDLRSVVILSRRPHSRTGWLVGTPSQIVDRMVAFQAASGVDGFMLIPCPPGEGIESICSLLVPEMQRRGLTRSEWEEPQTLRERYFGRSTYQR